MIEKFLDNNKAPVCGFRMFILVKRYPNETDIDRLVAKLRQYHAGLTVYYSMTPSGGYHSETLYKLATRTNGFCSFDYDNNFHNTVAFESPSYFTYLIYAANPQISGQGNISLATMRVPVQDDYWFEMTVQDRMPIDVAETVMLKWSRFGSSYSNSLGVSERSTDGYFSKNVVADVERLYQDSYTMSLSYKFSDANVKTLQIRVYNDKPINYWVPYDN